MVSHVLADQKTTSAFAADCRAFVHTSDERAAARLLEKLAPGNTVECRQHPLGLVFFDLGCDGYDRFRLHVWPEGQRVIQDSRAAVHDHVFALDSRILVGCLVNRVYQVEPDPHGTYSMYEVNYTGADSRTELRPGRYSTHEIRSERHSAFARYKLAIGTFHRSDVDVASFAATIVVETFPPPPRPSPLVLMELGGRALAGFARSVVEAAQARSYILQASSLLSRTGTAVRRAQDSDRTAG